MLIKLCTIFIFMVRVIYGGNQGHDWDLAVATDEHIELLLSNGTVLAKVGGDFAQLKALTFDNIRHQFVFSDMDEENNDTIYGLDLTKETDTTPIIADLPDDVQGLAVDPIEDVLYWTDSINHTINYLSLKEKKPTIKNLFVFDEAKPQDIAVDICRRYIYWTNSLRKKPTIERSKIGSKTKEIIVDSDLGMPFGITIDYRTKRLYWTDVQGGIYYKIESTTLEGLEREIVYQGIHSEPFALAVKDEYLYFTDLRRNALWKFDLAKTSQPKIIKMFENKPMGLIAKKEQIKTLPDCAMLDQAYKNYTKPTKEKYKLINVEDTKKDYHYYCINGTLQDGVCKCAKGFSGIFCEISFCHNYCFFGSCHLTSQGFPFCECPKGFGGSRCEKNCEGYCLNGGGCSFGYHNAKLPVCTCPKGFRGARCEESEAAAKLCDVYCSSDDGSTRNTNEEEFVYCKCSRRNYVSLAASQSPEALLSTANPHFFNYFQDPVFITLGFVASTTLIVCLVLTIIVFYLRRRPTPRIKRRYIVNKNPSTSMTERPQHPEQCEITIENCCNMNVCETPCFEPSKLQSYRQSKSDDKKMLLPNMEKTEEFY